jgi:hypothetical protein
VVVRTREAALGLGGARSAGGNRNGNDVGNGNRNGDNINNGNRANISGNTVNRNTVVVSNLVYGGAAWGWNGGVAWAPAPYYWGGGFWRALAISATTAAIHGSIVHSNVTYTSYQVQPNSPGATFLSNYGLTQVQCDRPVSLWFTDPTTALSARSPTTPLPRVSISSTRRRYH